MKTAKLKNGLICVSVPSDAKDFYVSLTYTKYILYQKDNHNYSIELPFRNFNNYQILGTITSNETTIDSQVLVSYDINYKPNTSLFSRFKLMIEAETEFLFSNPLGKRPALNFNTNENNIKEWQQAQSRVIEKLLILKTI
jgi:hypothetical protein